MMTGDYINTLIEGDYLHPLQFEARMRRIAPFMVGAILAALSSLFLVHDKDVPTALIMVALVVAINVATMVTPWARLPRLLSLLPVLALFPIIAILRNITGHEQSPYVALVLLPLFWVILYGTSRDLMLVIAGMTLTVGLPALLSDMYPLAEMIRMIVLISLGGGLGFSVQKSLRVRNQSQARLARIIETAHDAYISLGKDGLVRDWNGHAQQLFGYSRDEAMGVSLTELIIPPEMAALHDAGMKRFMDTGEGRALDRRLELPAVTRDGRRLTVEITITALKEADSWCFHAFLHDITERKASERDLARSRMIVDNSDEAIYSYALDGIVETWNEAACRLYGYSPGQAIGSHIGELTFPADETQDQQMLEMLRRGSAVDHVEVKRRHCDGSLLNVEMSASPMLDDAGKITGLSVIARDIQMRLQAREALEKANNELLATNELKDQFVAMASHELRTPLTSVLGFARTLRTLSDRISEQERLEFLQIIEDQALRLQRLIEDLLTLSKVESGKLRKNAELINPSDVARQVVQDLEASDVKVAGDESAKVYVDMQHLRQIISNLVVNAMRYGQPPITVTTRVTDSMVCIKVEDQGEGVPVNFVPHLFERFSQAGEVSGGTGLGLSIVQSLARSYDGEIAYVSQPDEGACFEVQLPRYSSDGSKLT